MKIIAISMFLVIAGILIASVPMPTPAQSPIATPTKQIYPPYEWCEWQSYNSKWICNWMYVPVVSNWGSLSSAPRELSGKLVYGDGTPNSGVTMRLGTVFYCEDGCFFWVSGGTSPATETDDDGNFIFEKLIPARYVILVHSLFDNVWWILADDNNGQEIWDTYDSSLNVGTIIFDVID